jgi:hypothetical protein
MDSPEAKELKNVQMRTNEVIENAIRTLPSYQVGFNEAFHGVELNEYVSG